MKKENGLIFEKYVSSLIKENTESKKEQLYWVCANVDGDDVMAVYLVPYEIEDPEEYVESKLQYKEGHIIGPDTRDDMPLALSELSNNPERLMICAWDVGDWNELGEGIVVLVGDNTDPTTFSKNVNNVWNFYKKKYMNFVKSYARPRNIIVTDDGDNFKVSDNDAWEGNIVKLRLADVDFNILK